MAALHLERHVSDIPNAETQAPGRVEIAQTRLVIIEIVVFSARYPFVFQAVFYDVHEDALDFLIV